MLSHFLILTFITWALSLSPPMTELPLDKTASLDKISLERALPYLIQFFRNPIFADTNTRDSIYSSISCYEENTNGYECGDIKIQCQFWAPSGIKIAWFKDGNFAYKRQTLDNIKHLNWLANGKFEPNIIETTILNKNSYKFYLNVSHYIRCAKKEDEGLYGINLLETNDRTTSILFNVNLSASDYYGPSCIHCMRSNINFLHLGKIAVYAKKLIANVGSDISLPCRVQDSSRSFIIWTKSDFTTEKMQFTNFQEWGDLQIKNVSVFDEGWYSCAVYTPYQDKGHVESDKVLTQLYVNSQKD